MGRPILFNAEHKLFVRQPMVSEVVDMGEDVFNELIMPFTLTSEAVFNGQDNVEELASKYDIYDLFFERIEEDVFVLDNVFGGKSALGILKDSLSYFLQADEIQFLMNRRKIAVDQFVMDKEEFMKLRLLIQGVSGKSDVTFEKIPKNMTERQKDIWAKLQAGRRRTAEREALYLQDMINFTSFGGSTYIPLNQIDSMTYYQLSNAYKSVMSIDAHKIGMGYKLSYKFDVKDEIKHWSEALKVGK